MPGRFAAAAEVVVAPFDGGSPAEYVTRHNRQSIGEVSRPGGAALLIRHDPELIPFGCQPEYGFDEIRAMLSI